MNLQALPLPYAPGAISGLSERLMSSHHQNNYGGAVKRLNAIRAQLAATPFASTPGFVLNGLKREELIATNSMLLHELYFASLGGDGQTMEPAMRLALEKTRQQYGDYELRDSLKMNKARMRLEVQKPGKSALFIVDSWPQKTPHPEVSQIPFPIDLGILGYRVCFVGADRADALAGVRTLAQLQAFSQGSGKGWQDADILRHNGFQVQEVDNYESLFRMVARGRVDLFCRGANEILAEWETHHPRLPTLTVDRHVILFYPLIHAFYSHVTYHKERERIQLGLRLAWQAEQVLGAAGLRLI